MSFIDQLSGADEDLIRTFKLPIDIQNFLDSIPYVGENRNRTPLEVVRDRQCHCLDGGLFAAAALRLLGYPPMIMDLVPEPGTDDDHVLAVFKYNQRYGAVAKSNFVGLRFREPVYTSLRELAMSYFEMFYNIEGFKTLRGYTRPLNLTRYDRYEWETSSSGVNAVVERFYAMKSTPLLDEAGIRFLSKVDRRSYEAGMLGVNFEGLYKPAVGLE
jgi:hypothetical protein